MERLSDRGGTGPCSGWWEYDKSRTTKVYTQVTKVINGEEKEEVTLLNINIFVLQEGTRFAGRFLNNYTKRVNVKEHPL